LKVSITLVLTVSISLVMIPRGGVRREDEGRAQAIAIKPMQRIRIERREQRQEKKRRRLQDRNQRWESRFDN
jgi:hypothetical protein